ncbi:MAG TPA: PAS domain-containing protein [Rectinemataceae bacterium]|nr:PAS domain-containing protein [Rectinemataceae bacterium]
MGEELVRAMYETLPVEITVIDGEDKVVSWNRHDNRLFYRPEVSMGMNFRECHPQESLHLVERIVGDMKSGKRERARFWIDLTVDKKSGLKHKVLIDFYALRNDAGAYMGCMECNLDVEEIRHLEGERRLLDEQP